MLTSKGGKQKKREKRRCGITVATADAKYINRRTCFFLFVVVVAVLGADDESDSRGVRANNIGSKCSARFVETYVMYSNMKRHKFIAAKRRKKRR